jgi:hypothetical protein
MGLWGDELSIENTGFYMFVVGPSLSNNARAKDTLGDLTRRMGVLDKTSRMAPYFDVPSGTFFVAECRRGNGESGCAWF